MEYISDGFYEMFPDDVYDYSVWLAQTLKNHGKGLRVEDWEYLHEKLDGQKKRNMSPDQNTA